MPTYNIIKMKFRGPVHLGVGRDFYDTSANCLHSDTLSAALAAMGKMKDKEFDVVEFLNSFTISSAFPFSGKEYFLPKTTGKIKVTVAGKEEHQYRKDLKKVSYIEKSIWEKLNQGQQIEIQGNQLKDDFIVSSPKDFCKPMKHQVSQRVSVSRDGKGDSVPFYFDWTFFQKDAGLYCLVDADKEKFTEICELFTLLGETGIGSDKSVGGGLFSIEVDEMTISEPDSSDGKIILSLYIPSKEELESIKLAESRYSLILRGGYMSGSDEVSLRHLWKKSIYMIDCGSVVATQGNLKGQVVELTPNWNSEIHKVYRSGKPFCLNYKA